MRLEQQGRNVVESPFSGVFEWVTVLTMSLWYARKSDEVLLEC